jgi:hypothetical protein
MSGGGIGFVWKLFIKYCRHSGWDVFCRASLRIEDGVGWERRVAFRVLRWL